MKKQFETQSKRILDLMINSIYTNKEIFLREIISNASDALDKRYVKELENNKEGFDRSSFTIEIKTDKANRILEIIDTGIGMNKEDLEKNLGIIAQSGSLDFKNTNKSDEISIIGQFGVGFYSAFMVADKVEVFTKKENEPAYKWTSEGPDGYEIEEIDKEDVGTIVKLSVKETTLDDTFDFFLEEYYIKELVHKYSNYIKYPIKMGVKKTRTVKSEVEGEEDKKEEYTEIEILNSMVPIWEKQKNDLTDDDYINFYQEQRYGYDEPMKWVHLNVEGMVNYKAILYIPSEAPLDYYTKDYKKGLQLYTNGVMIMDKNEDLIPDHFTFVKGVVDSEDLSLNISREMLQHDSRLRTIAKNIEKRLIKELADMLENDFEKYTKFFDVFGLNLKASIYQSYGGNKDKLQDLLIFDSSKSDEKVTLAKYLVNMPEDQKYIYYAAGSSKEQIDKLPALQKIKEKGQEILYLTQEIDEFVIKMLANYEGKEFRSALSEEVDAKEEDLDEAEKVNRASLFEKMKNILGDEVKEVKASHRLIDDASCLVAIGEISIEMEKTFLTQIDSPQLKAEKVLEINPDHKIFAKLMGALSKNDEKSIEMMTKVLYDQARLIEGLPIKDVVEYTKNVMTLID